MQRLLPPALVALALLATSCNKKVETPAPEASTAPPALNTNAKPTNVVPGPDPATPKLTPETDPGSPKQTDSPSTPDPGPSKPVKLVPVDLTAYGVRAVIDLPEGYQIRGGYSDITIAAGADFKFTIEPARDPVENERATLRKEAEATVLAEPTGGYFITTGKEGLFATYKLRQDVTTGDKKFQATAMVYGVKTRPSADRYWDCIKTFHQTDAQQKAEGPRKAAVAKLTELQISLFESSFGRLNASLNSDKATDAVIPFLKDIPDLTEVGVFSSATLTPAGVKALATLEQVRSLTFSGTSWLTDANFKLLTPMPGLRSLRLENTRVSDAGLEALTGMPNLTSFSIVRNELPLTDAGMKHLAGLKKLTTLHVPGSPISSVGMAHLAGLTELQDLDLERTRVTDTGLEHLTGKAQLHTLNLAGTPVNGSGLTHLKAATGMKTIDLSGSDVTDEGLAGIRGVTTKILLLRYTNVGDAGVPHFAHLNGLDNLSLIATRVTDAGMKPLSVITATDLDLANTDVTGATLGELRACKNLRSLRLTATALTDATFPSIATLGVSTVYVDDTAITDSALKSLETLPEDRRLRINQDDWQFSEPAVKSIIAKRPMISFSSTPPVDPGPKELKPPSPPADLPKPDPTALFKQFDVKPDVDDDAPGKPVIEVSLSSDKLTDRDLANLRDLKQMKSLSIRGDAVTDEGLAHLAKLTALESLTLECKKVTDAGLGHLAGLTTLRSLKLRGCDIRGDGLVFLKGMKALAVLDLPTHTYLPRHLIPLAELTSLVEIDLGNALTQTSPHAAKLYTALPKLRSFSASKWNNQFLIALRGSSVESLMITVEGFHACSPRGLSSVGAMKNLKQLSIQSPMLDRGLAELGGLVGLEYLSLHWGEWVTDAGVAHLEKLSNLRSLNLTNNRITDAGTVHLEKLTRLEWLELSRNKITDAAIANVSKLQSIRDLRLNGTLVTDACIPTLVKMKSLRAVELYDTLVTPAAVKRLREARPDLTVHYRVDQVKE